MKYLLDGEETQRLKFRLLQDSDFDTWIDLFKNTNVAAFLGMAHLSTAEECCRSWFERGANRYTNDLGGMNVLIDKQSNDLIGQAGLLIQDVDGERCMEVGYSMLPRHWHKGYASEAAIKCRNHAFEHNFTDTLISIIHTENIGSIKVALHNGMTLYKTTHFKEMPVHIYRITKEEWIALSA